MHAAIKSLECSAACGTLSAVVYGYVSRRGNKRLALYPCHSSWIQRQLTLAVYETRTITPRHPHLDTTVGRLLISSVHRLMHGLLYNSI